MTAYEGKESPLTHAFIRAFENLLRERMFCLPAFVKTFDPETQLAQIQCGVKRIDGGAGASIPPIDNVPVHFAGDDTHYLWHSIKPDTEGLIVFSQRSIDEWIDRGGENVPVDSRVLSGDDAFFIPGCRSIPGAIPDFKNEGCGISRKDGTKYVWLNEGDLTAECDDLTANVTNKALVNCTDLEAQASGTTLIESPEITLKGNVTIDGNVDMNNGYVKSDGTVIDETHKHSGVTAGFSNTGPPV